MCYALGNIISHRQRNSSLLWHNAGQFSPCEMQPPRYRSLRPVKQLLIKKKKLQKEKKLRKNLKLKKKSYRTSDGEVANATGSFKTISREEKSARFV